MKSNCSVTLWHLDGAGKRWHRKVLKNAFSSYREKLSKSGIKQVGFYSSDFCTIRIPGSERLVVSVGDYVRIGEYRELEPERTLAMKVIEVRDNRCGSSPHWKLLCGG